MCLLGADLSRLKPMRATITISAASVQFLRNQRKQRGSSAHGFRPAGLSGRYRWAEPGIRVVRVSAKEKVHRRGAEDAESAEETEETEAAEETAGALGGRASEDFVFGVA